MTPRPIDVVYLDIGGILSVDFVEQKVADLAEKYQFALPQALDAKKTIRPQVDRGQLSEREFWKSLLKVFGVEATEEDCSWDRYLVPIQSGLELVENLRSRGYRLGIISNDSRELSKERRELLELERRFEVVVFSCDHGVIKPAAEIYTIALNALSVKAERSLFLDDRPENVEGARRAGMQAIFFESPDQAIQDLRRLEIL